MALDPLDHRRHADDVLTPDTRVLTFDPDAASALVDRFEAVRAAASALPAQEAGLVV